MDEALRRLLARLLDDIAIHAEGANVGRLTGDQFQAAMARTITEGHLAAYYLGREVDTLSPQAKRAVTEAAQAQLDYLNPFADEVAAGTYLERPDALAARAALYAGAVKSMWSRATWWDWPLPWHPGDGSTPCLGNCRCFWEAVVIDAENLDADFIWRMGATERHCGECPSRAANSPYQVRGGAWMG